MQNVINLTFAIILLVFLNSVNCFSGAFYADNGRQQSILYKTLAKEDKTELREEILQLLGLNHRPTKKGNKRKRIDIQKSSAERYLLDLYKKIEEEDEDDICGNSTCDLLNDSDFIVSFPNKIHHQFPHLRHERDRRFYFDVKKIPAEEEIVNAELRIYRNNTRRSRMNKKYKYALYLFAVTEDADSSNTLELVDQLIISGVASKGWLVFNVTSQVMKWIAFPKNNLGLYLKIKSLTKYRDKDLSIYLDAKGLDNLYAYCDASWASDRDNRKYVRGQTVDPHEIGIVSSKASDEYKAFMVAYFKTPNHLRIRRPRATRKKKQERYYDLAGYNPYSSHKDRYHSKAKNCERWTLYVSFRDLGFEDWIIAPDGYAAFYCDGSCTFPLNAHMNATNHAIVQTLMHLMDPTAVPKPCCAPTQLTSITVLYFDDNSNVILKKYKNMVVKSCGCH